MKWILLPMFFLACTAMVCSKQCSSNDDCGKGECCVTLSLRTARRGSCLSLSQLGKKCSMPKGTIKKGGEKYFMACPCEEGLTCSFKNSIKELVFGDMAVLVMKCRKSSPSDVKPVEQPVGGDDGVEVVYEEVDGGAMVDEEIVKKAVKEEKNLKK